MDFPASPALPVAHFPSPAPAAPDLGNRHAALFPLALVAAGAAAVGMVAVGVWTHQGEPWAADAGERAWQSLRLLSGPVLAFLALCAAALVLRRRGEELRGQCAALDTAARELARQGLRQTVTEEDLREKDLLCQALLHGLPGQGFFVLDDAGRVAAWNQTAERVYGLAGADALGRPYETFFRPEDRDAGRPGQELGRVAAAGRWEDRGWRLRGDGTPFWAEIVLMTIPAPPPARPGLLVMTRDLTGQRRAEEELRQSRTQYHNLTETARDVVIALSAEGAIASLNRAFETATGWPRGEWVGRPFTALVHPEDLPRVGEMLGRLAREGRPPVTELRFQTRSGAALAVEFTATAQTEAGRPAGLLGIARDVSERKQAEEVLRRTEENLRQAQKMEAVGRLAGGVAHDFNNLLTVITGYSDILLQQMKADDPARGPVAEIGAAAGRAASLTGQLLAFSRKQVLRPRVLDLNALVASAAKMLGRLIGEDIELATDLAPGALAVRADPGQVEQVLMNLAVNARDAMPRGGRLRIHTRAVERGGPEPLPGREGEPGRYVLLEVSDTGCGMPPEVRDRLFEPFFTTKEVGKGTGLGLATVYGIVTQSGGAIDVASAPGQGTTFTIYLPKPPGLGAAADPGPADAAEPAGGRETVLLVEDEDGVRGLAGQALSGRGYTVLEARGGTEALALAERHPGGIDVLVTDVVMPGLGGVALARRLAEARPGLRVLYMSGYTDSVLFRHGVEQDAINYLWKPFKPLELVRRVREVLDAPAPGQDPCYAGR